MCLLQYVYKKYPRPNNKDANERDKFMEVKALVNRLQIEFKLHDRSGVYGLTQRELAYNSNKIEGSTLSREHTSSLFETGTIYGDDIYRSKDIEETTGHFLMFNHMLKTLDEPLTEKLIKEFHYELKSGVFEDRANGYAIGDYKERPNIVGTVRTSAPEDVSNDMLTLLDEYKSWQKNIETLARFHVRYENIHPFQDGNGRTGRIILFRECLVNDIMPFIIQDINRDRYIRFLDEAQKTGDNLLLEKYFVEEQEHYREQIYPFIKPDLVNNKKPVNKTRYEKPKNAVK